MVFFSSKHAASQSRRRFLARAAASMTTAMIGVPAVAESRHGTGHVCLLGDSILDNGRYTGGKPAVIAQVRDALPRGWSAQLLAVDGATTADIGAQLARLPKEATHLVLSAGGNDALGNATILDRPAASVGEALTMLAALAERFEAAYRQAIAACLAARLPLTVCTIYHGNFPDADYQRRASAALTHFNNVILRAAIERHLRVIDLRQVCRVPADFANAIEPSSIGGAKIAAAIARAVAMPPTSGLADVLAG